MLLEVMNEIATDLCVIGAGSGGLSVAAGAAQLGLEVVLFEKGEMGGDCLNTGCVPSKALIAAAQAAHDARTAARLGVTVGEPQVDFAAVMAHVHAAIAAIAPHDSQERFEGLGCTVVREHARFTGPRTVESDSVRVHAGKVVIATGSRPRIPPIPGLDAVSFLTNETIFALTALPPRLLVLGAGPIGLELGQAFRRLGSEVIVIEAGEPLPREDRDGSAARGEVREHLRGDLRRVRADARSGHAVIGGRDDDRRRERPVGDVPEDRGDPARQLLEPPEAAERLRLRIERGRGGGRRPRISADDARDRLVEEAHTRRSNRKALPATTR